MCITNWQSLPLWIWGQWITVTLIFFSQEQLLLSLLSPKEKDRLNHYLKYPHCRITPSTFFPQSVLHEIPEMQYLRCQGIKVTETKNMSQDMIHYHELFLIPQCLNHCNVPQSGDLNFIPGVPHMYTHINQYHPHWNKLMHMNPPIFKWGTTWEFVGFLFIFYQNYYYFINIIIIMLCSLEILCWWALSKKGMKSQDLKKNSRIAGRIRCVSSLRGDLFTTVAPSLPKYMPSCSLAHKATIYDDGDTAVWEGKSTTFSDC